MSIANITATPIFGRIKPETAIVSSLGEHLQGQYVLVRVEDGDGQFGLGEASVTSVWSGETQAGAIALVHDVLAPLLIGSDPFDLDWIVRQMDRAAFANSFAKAAVEMALYDLQGKILGVPLCQLIGGRRKDENGIRLKFVVGAVEPHVAAERAKLMVDKGWQSIKVKVGKDPHPQTDIDRLRAVREAVGANVWLSVDANGGYTVADAIWTAARLEELEVALFEQPTRRGDHRAMAELRRNSSISIMADESVFTPQDALEIIHHRAADVLSLYPGKHGGIRQTQQIAKLAESAGIPCTIGSNLEREVATAAMAHLTVATANLHCERFPGDLIGPVYYQDCLTTTPLSYQADRLFVPDGNGLGIEVEAD